MGFYITGISYFRLVEIGEFINRFDSDVYANMDVIEEKPYWSETKYVLAVSSGEKNHEQILKKNILEQYDCFPGITFLSSFDKRFYLPLEQLCEISLSDCHNDSGKLPELVNTESYTYLKESLCKKVVLN
jgi:hypothetical protein